MNYIHRDRQEKHTSVKHVAVAIVAGIVISLLPGCANVQQSTAFLAAGSPADKKCALCVTYDLCPFELDGELVRSRSCTKYYVVEMLPGIHQIEAAWLDQLKPEIKIKGRFEAEAGKNYIFLTDISSSEGSVPLSVRYKLLRAYIVELPPGRTLQDRMEPDRVLRQYKVVAVLY